MSFLRSRFFHAVLIVGIAFCVFRFGIRPPAPWSVIRLYMTVVLLATLIYVSADSDSWRNFVRPIRSTLMDPSRRTLRYALMVVVPLLLGYYAYTRSEERRVEKECRSRWSPYHQKKIQQHKKVNS